MDEKGERCFCYPEISIKNISEKEVGDNIYFN